MISSGKVYEEIGRPEGRRDFFECVTQSFPDLSLREVSFQHRKVLTVAPMSVLADIIAKGTCAMLDFLFTNDSILAACLSVLNYVTGPETIRIAMLRAN